jgi:hypothetical protein
MTAAVSCDFSVFSGPSRDEFMYESGPTRDEYGYESKNEFPSREESGTH